MNERILKLARKSGATVNEGFDGTKNFVYGITMSPEELEKFAELIAKECAGIYSKIDNGNLHMGTDNYLEALHKTFFEVADAPVDNVDRILRTVRTRGVEHGQEETSKKV